MSPWVYHHRIIKNIYTATYNHKSLFVKLIVLRIANPQDLTPLQQLFVNTLHKVCSEDYTTAQINAWASSSNDSSHWRKILTTQLVLIAEFQNNIVGFASLTDKGHIDMFYVHHQFQHQGIGRQLYTAILTRAHTKSISRLEAAVSITAKPFFEAMGFKKIAKQTISRQGVELSNFKMYTLL